MGSKQFTQEQKLKILKSAAEIGVRESAKIAGVHYTTVYDWRRQLESLGEAGFLEYQPSYPDRGVKKIWPQQEKSIMEVWEQNPGFGPNQVRNQLRRQGITISSKTVRKVMKANGYKMPGKKSNKKDWQRFEARRPLELAQTRLPQPATASRKNVGIQGNGGQVDILEFFINKMKIYMILLLDDFSRFILGWKLLEQTSVDEVIDVVSKAIDRYGKMDEILTDRGFVFYSWRGINRFERFLETHRIDHTHARPHHPQTLGKVEACNQRIKRELIDQRHFPTMHDANSEVEQWVYHYNYDRSHQGIGGLLVPAERFHGQADKVLDRIDQGIDITKQNGYISTETDRSIINLSLSPDGKVTLWLLGQPVIMNGGAHAG